VVNFGIVIDFNFILPTHDMSQAELLKVLKVKTNSVKRVHKELKFYLTDRDRQIARVQKMKDDGEEPHDIKQAVRRRMPHMPPLGTALMSRCGGRRTC
jgi:hypothetical protein